ncbi:MAG: ATP-binding cassette domain-containing protein, partial [Verrucomicrobiota bacterium]
MSEIAVRITNLSKKFNRTVALDNVSLDIPANTLYGMLGPNGAGKTTLFGVAAGFLKATSGEIEVHGINVKNISALRGRMSML